MSVVGLKVKNQTAINNLSRLGILKVYDKTISNPTVNQNRWQRRSINAKQS
jgi:hypothetical protein